MKSEDPPPYGPTRDEKMENEVIAKALFYLERRLGKPGEALSSPTDVKAMLTLKLGDLPHEVFAVLWLDTQHRLIAYEELFRGTLTQTSVYPREVVKAALRHNAGAVILSHNHPSGVPEPSRADEVLTGELKTALALVGVRVLDHIIVGGAGTLSFAERGLI